MSFIEWRDTFSVFVPDMDKQHQGFIGLINELHEAMEAGQEQSIVASVIMRLVHYAESHFVDEEALMYRIGYPQIQAHRTAHRRLIDRVLEFKVEYRQTGTVSAQELSLFLKNWLTTHIQQEDADYGRFIARSQHPQKQEGLAG